MEQRNIFLYGEFGFDITTSNVQDQLKNLDNVDEIIMHISSNGGGVFEGYAIGNIIKGTGKKITAVIEGICASIATYPALLADHVKMAETARFVIHNPTMFTEGDQKDMENASDMLSTIKGDLLRLYNKKTGLDNTALSALMDKETMMTPAEAKASGFIDEVVPPVKAVARFDIPKEKIMPDKKQEESIKKIDSILDQIKKIPGIIVKGLTTVKNAVTLEMANGDKIYVASTDGELEGKPAFTVDEQGNFTDIKFPAGDFKLTDGRTITINEEGIVMAVVEGAEGRQHADEDEEKLLAVTKENEALKAQLSVLKNKEEALVNENKTLDGNIQETNSNVAELIKEVNNLKELTVGEPFKQERAITNPPDKFNNVNKPEPNSTMELWGGALRNKYIPEN